MEMIMIKLKELRQIKNLTQKQVADFLKCNQTAVGKYERGELEPSISNICKLANFFGCTTDYLLGREDDFGVVTVTADINSTMFTPEETELLRDFRLLDKSSKNKVIGYCHALL